MKAVAALLLMAMLLIGCDSSEAPKPPIIQTKSQQSNIVPSGESVGEPALHIGLYPDARVLSSHVNEGTVQADFETGDPVEKVIAYYESELGVKSDGKAPMTTVEGDKNGYHFAVVIAPKEGKRTAVSVLGERK